MLPISQILAPVDFSERCLGMMPYVKALARKYDSEVILLHVVNPFYAVPPTALSGPVMIPIPESVLPERQKQLDEFAVAELREVRVRRLVYEGDPAGQIVTFANAENISLIVMPTHGYGVLRRFLIGSDTAKVLHDASCPVLTGVHIEKQPAAGTLRLFNILCAIDLTAHSEKTLGWASRLSTDLAAKLNIVHTLAPLRDDLISFLPIDFAAQRERTARSKAEEFIRKAGAKIGNLHIQEGEAAKTISSFAKAVAADLLIIGRSTPEESDGTVLMNAYGIIRQSPCPVISV